MSYTVEISFDLNRHNINSLKNYVQQLANNFGCISIYDDYEFESSYKLQRTHCVTSIDFEVLDEKSSQFYLFLKQIKKISGVNIECIYDNNLKKIIYASKFYVTYLSNIPYCKKNKSVKKTRSFSETDVDLFKDFFKNLS
jgi:hypothetical protein